jgi:hypothetical protein
MSASEEPIDEPGGVSETVNVEAHTPRISDGGHPVPLFLRDGNEGQKGNAQDEKDETGE